MTKQENISSWPQERQQEYHTLVERMIKDYAYSRENAENKAYDSVMADIYWRAQCDE